MTNAKAVSIMKHAFLWVAMMVAGCAHADQLSENDPLQWLRSVAGCWQGQGVDGRAEVLRIDPHDWGVQILSASGNAANCRDADPLLAIEQRAGSTVAYSMRVPKDYGWTVSANENAILFAPSYAPVWMRLKRNPFDRLEWSIGGSADPVVLSRSTADSQ